MRAFLTKGLTETAALWPDVEQGYAWVHKAAHLLSNDDKLAASEVRQTYETLLADMEQTPTSSEPLATMLSTLYGKLDLSPLDTGLQQGYTCCVWIYQGKPISSTRLDRLRKIVLPW